MCKCTVQDFLVGGAEYQRRAAWRWGRVWPSALHVTTPTSIKHGVIYPYWSVLLFQESNLWRDLTQTKGKKSVFSVDKNASNEGSRRNSRAKGGEAESKGQKESHHHSLWATPQSKWRWERSTLILLLWLPPSCSESFPGLQLRHPTTEISIHQKCTLLPTTWIQAHYHPNYRLVHFEHICIV